MATLKYDVFESAFLLGLDLPIDDESIQVELGRINEKPLTILGALRLKNHLTEQHAAVLAIGQVNYSPSYRIVPA